MLAVEVAEVEVQLPRRAAFRVRVGEQPFEQLALRVRRGRNGHEDAHEFGFLSHDADYTTSGRFDFDSLLFFI